MRNFKKTLALAASAAMVLSMAGCGSNNQSGAANDGKINYVASFYPMYILTENLTKDIDNVNVSCMADMNFGCIHDYTMKTEDLKNIENCTAFIENGFDLEPFNDKIEQAYPDMTIVKSSDGITIGDYGYTDLAADEDDEDAEDEGGENAACCGSTELNPHIWTDINIYMDQVKNVAESLKKIDTANADAYTKNCDDYISKLTALKADYDTAKTNVSGKKAVILDETLPNFCHSVGIDYLFLETDHEQQSLSAADLKDIIDTMKSENISAVFIAKNSDDSSAKILADETGATIYELNTCMVGADNADAYITDMTENLGVLNSLK